MNQAQKSNNYVWVGLMLMGLSPVFMAIVPWDFGPDMNPYRGFMRGLSMTVPLLESVFILLATANGFSPFAAIREAPKWTKIGFVLLLAVIIAGAVFSAKVSVLSLVGLGKISLHALFFLAVCHQLGLANTALRNKFWQAVGLGLLAYWGIWGLNIWLFEPQGNDWVTMVPGVTNVRSLGFFALSGFFAGLAIAMGHKMDRYRSLLGTAIAVAALVMVLWTGSRGALLAVVAGAFALIFFGGASRNALAKFYAIVLCISVGITLLLPTVNPNYGIERIIFSSVAPPAETDISSGRAEMWRETAKKIVQKPVIGWGVEQFSVAGPERTLGFKQPHNVFLQILFSTGLLGAIATLLIVLPFLSRLTLDISIPDRLAAWGLIIGTLTFGLYDAAFYYTYPVMIFLLSVAMVLKPVAQMSAADKSN